jgi:uncharacterized protein
MSQENVEIVRRAYKAMEAGDVDGVAALAHPDVEWISDSRVGVGPLRGVENVIAFFMDQREVFVDATLDAERFFDQDDLVLVFLRVAATGRGSGARVEIRIAHLWTLRDGRLVRGEGYGNRDEALEAAGLSE